MSTTTYMLTPAAVRGDGHPGLIKRLYRAYVAAQQRRADEIAIACLAQLSPDQLSELGHSTSEIRDLHAQRGRIQPFWV